MRHSNKFVALAVLGLGIATPATYAVQSVADLPRAAVPFVAPAAKQLAEMETLSIDLPEGRQDVFTIRRDHPDIGMTGIRGDAPNGDRLYLFVADGQIVSGDVFGSAGSYQLIENQGRVFWASVLDLPALNIPIVPQGSIAADTIRSQEAASVEVPLTAVKGTDGRYLIDVLVLYTPKHEQAVGNERAHIQSLIFLANNFMDVSKVPVHYRLVAASRYNKTSEDVGFYQNLDQIAADSGVKGSRNGSKADVVVLLRALGGVNPEGISGLSRPFNNAEQSEPPANVSPERDAFAVVASQSSRHVFAHELGHLLGGGHAFAEGAASYWRPYAHASVCRSVTGGISSMSLMTGNNVGSGDISVRGDFISNPELLKDGLVCGLDGVADVEPTEANNARAMTEAAPYVSAYRGARRNKASEASDPVVAGCLSLFSSLLVALLQGFLGPRGRRARLMIRQDSE